MKLLNFRAVTCLLLQVVLPAFSKEDQSVGHHVRGTATALSGAKQAVTARVGSNVLSVHLDMITNLPSKDMTSTSEMYAILEVERDTWGINKSFGKQRSEVVEDLNPVFDEDFQWSLPDLENMVLKVGVWDEDLVIDDRVGDAEIQLDDLELTATPREVTAIVKPWREFIYSSRDEAVAVAYFTISYKNGDEDEAAATPNPAEDETADEAGTTCEDCDPDDCLMDLAPRYGHSPGLQCIPREAYNEKLVPRARSGKHAAKSAKSAKNQKEFEAICEDENEGEICGASANTETE